MKRLLVHVPLLVISAICILLLMHGPIAQFPDYHAFADQSVYLGIPHAADVLSNIGFALVSVWGLWRLLPLHGHPALNRSWPGYFLFLSSLLLTAFGSSFYHLAPDNARLLWDRLPIALACAGLLAGVRADTVPNACIRKDTVLLGFIAIASVVWWYITDLAGSGDLRPYLLVQGMPLILIPLWQAIHRAPKADRIAFGAALALYVIAKLAEVNDHILLQTFGVVSGHTIKHVLAAAAAAVLVNRLIRRHSSDAGASEISCG